MLNAEMSFISLRYCLIATFPDIISLTSIVEKQIGVVPIDCKFQDFGLVRFVLVLVHLKLNLLQFLVQVFWQIVNITSSLAG